MDEALEIAGLALAAIKGTTTAVEAIIEEFKTGAITGDIARAKLQVHTINTAANRAAEDTEIAAYKQK